MIRKVTLVLIASLGYDDPRTFARYLACYKTGFAMVPYIQADIERAVQDLTDFTYVPAR